MKENSKTIVEWSELFKALYIGKNNGNGFVKDRTYILRSSFGKNKNQYAICNVDTLRYVDILGYITYPYLTLTDFLKDWKII